MRHLRSTFQYISRAHKTQTKPVNSTRGISSSAPAQEPAPPPPPPPPPASEKVTSIVEEISGLSLLEISDLTEVLRNKLDIKEMPIMAVMMPGMGFSTGIRGGGTGSGGAKGAEAAKEEKTVFDVKLEGYEAAGKIKVIKEVRGFTDLGLKEAKELVEKAPTLLKRGVTKEEAEKIIEKMKEVGAKVVKE